MSKVFNNRLKGKQLATSIGLIQFDANGVADIADEEMVEKLLELKGYSLAEEGENSAQNLEKDSETEKTSPEEKNTQENDENTSEDVQDEEDKAEDKSEEVEGDSEDAADEGAWTEEKLANKNVPQLKKIAKDNNIDLNGASKKDEIIAIILGALS